MWTGVVQGAYVHANDPLLRLSLVDEFCNQETCAWLCCCGQRCDNFDATLTTNVHPAEHLAPGRLLQQLLRKIRDVHFRSEHFVLAAIHPSHHGDLLRLLLSHGFLCWYWMVQHPMILPPQPL